MRARAHRWNECNRVYVAAKRVKWAAANKPKIYALNAARRGRELMATPPWAYLHKKDFEAVYAERERITKETGIIHHVDHIYPLKGKNSCGLHVPWNLRIITKTENLRKNNRSPDEITIRLPMGSG